MHRARRTLHDAGLTLLLLGAVCLIAAFATHRLVDGQAAVEHRATIESKAAGAADAIDAGAEPATILALLRERDVAYGALVDRDSRVLARRPAAGIDNGQLTAIANQPRRTVRIGGGRYDAAVAEVSGGGRLVLIYEPRTSISVLPYVAGAAGLWLALVLMMLAGSAYSGRRRLELEGLARRLVDDEPSPAQREDAVMRHGDSAHLLFDLAEHLAASRKKLRDTRAILRSFLVMGSHYTLLCRLDGTVLEANPAFLARLGLTPEGFRERSSALLGEMLPMDELLDLARRSLVEDATLSNIPCVASFDGEPRTLEATIRAVGLHDGTAVLLMFNDRVHERRLERQIDQFSDSIELMVDQRVARVTAGRASTDALLTDAGIALIQFDRDGGIRSMNRGADQLTGRTQFSLVRFEDLVTLLFDREQAPVFRSWFNGSEAGALTVLTRTPRGHQDVVFVRGREERGGEVTRRILAGVVLPAPVAAPPTVSTGDLIIQLETLMAAIEPAAFPSVAQPYIEVIREAARRIGSSAQTGGDGAVPTTDNASPTQPS